MRVLTVREPWLWAIVSGPKRIENRSPGMVAVARAGERIGLHGSTTWSKRGQHDPRIIEVYGGPLPRPERIPGTKYLVHPACDGFGLIVATAIVEDVHLESNCCAPWGEREYRDASGKMVRGVCHLVLADVQMLDCVIPARGKLGLWHSAELDEAMADA